MLTPQPADFYESPREGLPPVLNVGNADCPFWPRGTAGGINTDIIATGFEDVRLDATRLPFHSESIRAVYAHHILEHLYRYDAVTTVNEWKRVLIPGGILSVVVPDWQMLFHMVDLRDGVERDKILFGHDDTRGPYQPHRAAYCAEEVVQLLEFCGFRDVETFDPLTYIPLVARPRWQACVKGHKP